METTFNKNLFKKILIRKIRAIADIKRKNLTKYERDQLNDELYDLYVTIARRTNDICQRYSKD